MKIESDLVEIWSGFRGGISIGSPLGILIRNKDFKIEELPPVTAPRPGHADLAGAQKYGHRDIRNVLERASARETAARVALGRSRNYCSGSLIFGWRAGSRVWGGL